MPVEKVIQGKTVIVSPEHAYLLESDNWSWDKHGYLKRTIYVMGYLHPETQYLHSVIQPPKPGHQIDHVDRNKANNTRENLRSLLPWQNVMNTGPRRSEFGLKGVTRHKNKFRAQARLAVIDEYLRSSHDTPEEAAAAYDIFMREYVPDIAYLNYPERIQEYDWTLVFRCFWTLKVPHFIIAAWEKDNKTIERIFCEKSMTFDFDSLPDFIGPTTEVL